MKKAPDLCPACHLELVEGETHGTFQDCIAALRTALLRQRELAQSLAFDVSVQLLAALEELSLHPDVGVAYRIITGVPSSLSLDGDQPIEVKTMVLPPERVAGVFAAILKKYRELGDWSPLQNAENRAATYAYMAGKLTGKMIEVAKLLPPEIQVELSTLISELGSRRLVGCSPPRS